LQHSRSPRCVRACFLRGVVVLILPVSDDSPRPARIPSALSSMLRPRPRPTLFPYTTLFRSAFSPTDAPSPPRSTRKITASATTRSEEHTSELQSRFDLVCRLLLEKKKKNSKDRRRRAETDARDAR